MYAKPHLRSRFKGSQDKHKMDHKDSLLGAVYIEHASVTPALHNQE